MKKKLYIAILYHQHQPYYKDPINSKYYLPWVRLHAIKDYYDMCVWVEKFDNLKLNFNYVPSLMLQLQDYSKDAVDKELELTIKLAQELTFEDKVYILKNFFNCNYNTMIAPYKRYKELYDKRGNIISEDELSRKIKYFNTQDWIDLQMWSNLVWFDPYWRENDEQIKLYFEKSTNFTQQDKEELIKKQRWICGEIIKKHKQLQEEKKIEVSVSAFYHPILPILCDPQKAKVSNPNIELPKNIFSLKEDAFKQVNLAIDFYYKNFGCLPKGFWPSEGAVSEDIIPIISQNNIAWIATDEEILKNSLYLINKSYPQKNVIYKHYKIQLISQQHKPVYIIFRDRELSDKIGFIYYRWNYKDAIKDIQDRLIRVYNDVYKNNHSNETALVSIILDGENCWEFYSNDGNDFLNEFYYMLTSNEYFETTLVSEYISKNPNTEILEVLWPGSWINANYNIWIGHNEDNTAWDYVYKTRNFLIEYLKQNNKIKEEIRQLCWQEIYTAEGSDWFWWFGDEHYTSQSDIFDFLFRQHLKNVYLFLNHQPPKYLDIPIKEQKKYCEYTLPADFIKPKIDGKISDYFEWCSAGKYIPMFSSMHQIEKIVSSIYFGFDLENLYLRIDYNKEKLEENLIFNIFLRKKDYPQEVFCVKFLLDKQNSKYEFLNYEGFVQEFKYIMIDKIIELKIPFFILKTFPCQEIQFFVSIQKEFQEKMVELERIPEYDFIEIIHPDKSYIKKFWTI